MNKKPISKNEARHIALTYLLGWATEAMRTDSDFYHYISGHYVIDKRKVKNVYHGKENILFRGFKAYMPSKTDMKIIANEFHRIATELMEQKALVKNKYQNEKRD